MRCSTYVNFPGTCAEAFQYYNAHLGATVTFSMTHEHSPEASRLPPEWRHAVLHARLRIGDMELMRSAYLTLNVDADAEAERVYAALSDGGKVLMAMDETFFASRFGQVQDRFGINWMILHERPR
jgi:PhnB protein